MSTPAGWYDDGSGQQRWWDGTRWTDNVASPTPSPAAEDAHPAGFTPPFVLPTYAAPAAMAAPDTAYGNHPFMPPAEVSVAPTRRPSVLGLIGLGGSAVGVALVQVEGTTVIGWMLLLGGLVAAIVSLFVRGAKWPGIIGILIAVLGAIAALVISLIPLADEPSTDEQIPPLQPWDQSTEEPDSGTSTWEDLAVGSCWRYDEAEWAIGLAEIVGCDEEHSDEIFHEYTLTGDEFPGDDALLTKAEPVCAEAFLAFVGVPYEDSELSFWAITPTKASWNKVDDRIVQCSIYDARTATTTGTLKDARR